MGSQRGSGLVDNDELRRLITSEVQNQLAPLRQAVEQQGKSLRSLYSNGSGGPPGFLETARAEDNDRFQRIFDALGKLRPLEDFVTKHNATEEQREKDRIERDKTIADKLDESDKRLNARLAFAGLVVAILALLVGWLTYRDSQRKVGQNPPMATTSQAQPQDSGLSFKPTQ